MCNNFPTIKIAEGNAFTLIFLLKRRTYVAEKPIDEDIDVTRLTDVRVTLGGVEYAPTIETYGVRINVPATLARGMYNGLLTADYNGNAIRGAYENCVQIVAWNAQSNAQQYIVGSPYMLNAAYVLGYMPTDAELEELKAEWREKNAQLDQAIADAEAAKAEWEQKAADLDGVAQETSVEGIADSIGTPAIGQPGTLFAAIAAGGGGGGGGTGDAQESTSQAILAAVQSGNVTAIAELLNNAHGLDALRALIAAIPTTAPATPQNVTDASNAVIAAMPSVSGLATEANATANKNDILAAIAANAGIPTLTIPDGTAAQELAPNVLYIFATRTSTLTLTLGTPIVGIANEYHFFVVCGATAPTVNFPSGISWNGGNAPTIAANKTYEISILNNIAAYFEV